MLVLYQVHTWEDQTVSVIAHVSDFPVSCSTQCVGVCWCFVVMMYYICMCTSVLALSGM